MNIERSFDILLSDPTVLFIAFIVFVVALTVGLFVRNVFKSEKSTPDPSDLVLIFAISLVASSLISSFISNMVDDPTWIKGTITCLVASLSIPSSVIVLIPSIIYNIKVKINDYAKKKAERTAQDAKNLNTNINKNVSKL